MSSGGFASATKIGVGVALTPEDIATQLERGDAPDEQVARYALRLGDDALVLSQRLCWWVSRAPEMEEDIALANIALDLLGHARSFLTYAGSAWGRSEDDLAFFRDEDEFVCAQIVELENGDFGQTIARQVVVSLYQLGLYDALRGSGDVMVAAIAAKAYKEVEYHVDHAWQWVLRLGLGTAESRRRLQHGVEVVWPYVEELFVDDELIDLLGDVEHGGIAVRPSALRADFDRRLGRLFAEAGLEVPQVPAACTGGRRGMHREAFGPLLAEMQVLARRHPGASW
ncbi:ring-1,2-phenylacetyl-CoA epoxidase subunit PaaC [Austwickia chelonae]|uniref:Phenylacetate-CoA oxygenase subunit PaaI n=1 Tax=Austwickia chelonae NBRC 105200 TaxID=1184607 RepID=K6UNU3_9MICO|nr:1,2-phenylacetyl-CoA epoxidase subunit PaaC [Austwickia chelonae]GAB79256.1 phenylacetate-CoA oxygenase subunit PaaI [Austwickia chelonae NBRC 105200]SEW37647.1 ring-1,2-phenylacetyl-CoA epoxidase subunit PaaC [Austwickia chelonae]